MEKIRWKIEAKDIAIATLKERTDNEDKFMIVAVKKNGEIWSWPLDKEPARIRGGDDKPFITGTLLLFVYEKVPYLFGAKDDGFYIYNLNKSDKKPVKFPLPSCIQTPEGAQFVVHQ